MQLDRILEHNRAFVGGREARPLPPVETLPLAVVACYDPRLDTLIPESLGLAHGDAFLFRTAGASLKPDGTTLRSLALAVYMFGVRDVIVLGHTGCRMAAFDTSGFIDAFRRRGVAREAFGAEDLRSWAGAIPDPRRGAAMSVENIRAAPFLPGDLSVAGLVLDDTTGALEVVVKPGERAEIAAAPAHGPAPAQAPAPAPSASPAPPAPPPARAALSDPLAEAVHGFVHLLESTGRWREAIVQLRMDIAAQRSPRARLGLLERFAREVGAQSAEVRSAFARVQREASAAGRLRDPQELLRLFDEFTARS
jgi:carbonic anhydrase